jgi:hypothetical protein
MLVSDSHRFIFVRVRKTASRSMRSQLMPYVIPPPEGRWVHLASRARLVRDYRQYVYRAHDPITVAKKLMPAETFERYFKFAIVRNPWARLVSEYEFLLKSTGHARHQRVRKLGSFGKFVDMQIPRRRAYQLNVLCDRRGKLLMDFLGRMENLDADWKTICERIEIPYEPLPKVNVSYRKPYVDYYTPELRDRVACHWAREIETFGYEFGS